MMVIIVLLLLLLAVPVIVFAAEVFAAAVAGSRVRDFSDVPPSIAVIVPAHNESQMLKETIPALLAELGKANRLIVVADNCTDHTADVARALGAEVIERHDPERRGKGFALQYGLDHLMSTAVASVVIFVDADCTSEPGALARLAAAAWATKQPVQAQYLLEMNPDASRMQRLSAFALRLKNDLRLSGDAALGIPSIITGSGIALPWEIVGKVKLGTGNIVEDMALGIDLVCHGSRPHYLREAAVRSLLPGDTSSHNTQRTRWEHGHLMTIPYALSRLLPAAWRQRAWAPLGYALVVAVPPLSLLVLLAIMVLAIAAVVELVTGQGQLLVVAALALVALMGFSVLTAWWKVGRDLISAVDLLKTPVYAILKIPVYVALACGRPIGWVRTRRAGD